MTLRSVALLLTTLTILPPHSTHATFVIGGQAGYAYGQARTTSYYSVTPNANHTNLGLHGSLAGLFFGYDLPIKGNFILGLETNQIFSMLKWRSKCNIPAALAYDTDYIEQKLRFTSDLLVKAGYRYHNLLGYIKTGLAIGSWHFKSVFDSTHTTKPPAFSKSKTLPGLKLAIGIEGNMAKNINWGLEYNHTFFKSHTIQRPGAISTEYITYKISPHYGSLILRMMYKI